jgi:hypothetical protein
MEASQAGTPEVILKGPSRRLAIILLALVAASQAFALPGGAGGIFVGAQQPAFAPAFLTAIGADGMTVEHIGGYGYGVDREGFIVGGFGMALVDPALLRPEPTGDRLAGGIGGMIIGQRLGQGGRVLLDLCLRLGLGGIALGGDAAADGGDWRGWAVAYGEPYAELLVAATPWMALSVQAGYRFIGNFAPEAVFQGFFLRTPVLGFALSWGDFK